MRTPEQDDAPEYREWMQTAIVRHCQHRAWEERERRRQVLAGAVIGAVIGALLVGGMILTWGCGW